MPEALTQLPYYREYVDQILRPRVGKMVDEIRAQLSQQVWETLLDRVAREQGAKPDPQTLDKLRALLTETLGLRLTVQLNAEFAAPSPPPPPVQGGADVVDRQFPNNPLARAVGGVRKA